MSGRNAILVGLFCLFGLLLCGCGAQRQGVRPSDEMVMYSVTARVRGFDPAKAGDVSSALAISKIYEGLLQYSYLERPYRVTPCLAEALPEISDDGLTYTFRIRKGIYFHDDPCFGGKARELCAEDFIYSIKRVADVKNLSTGYWAYNDRVPGLDEFREASRAEGSVDYDMPVEGLQAPDRYTLVMKLKGTYPQLLWILTMHYAFAVPREAVEYYGDEFINHPVGTGAFELESWRRNYRLEFVRSQKWQETNRVETYPGDAEDADAAEGLLDMAGRQVPFLDRIVQYVIQDASTRWLKFVTGELESSGISRANWDAVITQERGLTGSLAQRGIRLYSTPTLDVFYIGFNMADPVVGKNKKLRQALTCAFNSDEWIEFYNGRIERARGPIPPGVGGYEDKPAPYPFDLDRARTLLAEAGYPGGIDASTGKRLQLTIELGSADPETRESTELTTGFFRKIGVILKPSYSNWPTFLGKMERKQCQLYRLGWVADYPDAENFMQLFYSHNESPGPNHSNFRNEQFDRLYEKIRIIPDSPERTTLYREMSDIVVEECPWIFMHHPMSYGLHHSWLKNYKPHDFPYGMVKYYRVDSDVRRR